MAGEIPFWAARFHPAPDACSHRRATDITIFKKMLVA
jgi:hypothetical protein